MAIFIQIKFTANGHFHPDQVHGQWPFSSRSSSRPMAIFIQIKLTANRHFHPDQAHSEWPFSSRSSLRAFSPRSSLRAFSSRSSIRAFSSRSGSKPYGHFHPDQAHGQWPFSSVRAFSSRSSSKLTPVSSIASSKPYTSALLEVDTGLLVVSGHQFKRVQMVETRSILGTKNEGSHTAVSSAIFHMYYIQLPLAVLLQ